MPEPPGLVVKKGTKRLAEGGRPGPSSSTWTSRPGVGRSTSAQDSRTPPPVPDRLLAGHDVAGLGLRHADDGLQPLGPRDAREVGAGADLLADLHRNDLEDAVEPCPYLQRLDLGPPQPRLLPPLLHLRLLHAELGLDRLPRDGQALLLDALAVLELVRCALRELQGEARDEPALRQLRVGVGPQARLPRLGRDPRRGRPLVEELALEAHPELRVAGVGRPGLRLRVPRLRLKLGVGELEDDGVRRNLRPGQENQALDPGLGLGRDPADVLGHERPEPAHLAHQLPPLHGVDDDRRPVDRGGTVVGPSNTMPGSDPLQVTPPSGVARVGTRATGAGVFVFGTPSSRTRDASRGGTDAVRRHLDLDT